MLPCSTGSLPSNILHLSTLSSLSSSNSYSLSNVSSVLWFAEISPILMPTHVSYFFKKNSFFLLTLSILSTYERKGQKEGREMLRKKNIYQLPPVHTLSGDQTPNLSVHGRTMSQFSHIGQEPFKFESCPYFSSYYIVLLYATPLFFLTFLQKRKNLDHLCITCS